MLCILINTWFWYKTVLNQYLSSSFLTLKNLEFGYMRSIQVMYGLPPISIKRWSISVAFQKLSHSTALSSYSTCLMMIHLCNELWILFTNIASGFVSPFLPPPHPCQGHEESKPVVLWNVPHSRFVYLPSLGIIRLDFLVPKFPLNCKLGLEA